ncbi:meiosis-specific protein ASY3 [Prosopis cineraria]|uniref:meiosis-specific protein ASY3 n=1 Tax=Prosopis cineraria TaxID=364024 RepID=UPI00240FF88F|nr:meiosis-specific protein ASY3 [Prosopis cineraria]
MSKRIRICMKEAISWIHEFKLHIQGQTGDCRSFGSNICPSSQSRKVSIGVMVNSVATTRHEATKGNEVNMTNTEKVISNVGNFNGEKGKVEGTTASFNMKPIVPEEVKCSRITKSFYQRTPNFETILQTNQASNLLVFTRKQDKPDEVDTSIFHSNDLNQKKFDGTTSKRKGRKERTTGTVEDEFTFNTAREVIKSDKTKPDDRKTEKRTEDLKMKLWEILGTTSSPKTRRSGSKTSNMDEEIVLPGQRFDQGDDKFVKTRQQSDTIETDSENPDHTNKRPATRSLSRKRASAKMQPPKTKSAPSPRGKKKQQAKGIFSPSEQWTRRQTVYLHGVSQIPLSEKDQRQNARQNCAKQNEAADKFCKETSKADEQLCDEEASSLREKMGRFRSFSPDHHKDYPQTRKIIPEKELCQSPITKIIDKHEGLEGSANGNQQEHSSPVAEDAADPKDTFQSPTFGLKTPTLSSSPGSTPKTSKQTLERDCDRQCAQKQCSNVDELKSSLPTEAAFFVKGKDAQERLTDSSFEERRFLKKREGLRDRHASDAQETSMLHSNKRLRSHEGVKFNDNSPPSLSSKGAGENDSIPEASEHTQDGFVRAVELFALELGKLKSKIKSVASRKSSEILTSVAEDMKLQLKNVHFQIEDDVEKHTNLFESKRKRLETRFEDQQKQLWLIHEKFKEEISLYIQDCRSAIEGLEAERIEIKGALEKQRASHRKLLSQVEKGVEIQLSDAQTKITAIQESARGKLIQLKHITAMCLKDDILKRCE